MPYGHPMYRPYPLHSSYLAVVRPCVRRLSLFGVRDRFKGPWCIALRCTEWPMMKEINANWVHSTACGRSFDNYCLVCLCPCKSCVWNDIIGHGAGMYKGSPSKDAAPGQRQQFFPFWFIKKSHRLFAYIPSVVITIED